MGCFPFIFLTPVSPTGLFARTSRESLLAPCIYNRAEEVQKPKGSSESELIPSCFRSKIDWCLPSPNSFPKEQAHLHCLIFPSRGLPSRLQTVLHLSETPPSISLFLWGAGLRKWVYQLPRESAASAACTGWGVLACPGLLITPLTQASPAPARTTGPGRSWSLLPPKYGFAFPPLLSATQAPREEVTV
jgi:hypothetical protein